MKSMIRQLAAFFFCLLASALAGAVTPDMPVATINARKILSDSRAAKDALVKFQTDFLPRENELQQLASALKDKAAELDKVGPSLAPTEFAKRQAELDASGRELKRKQQQFVEDRDARKRDDIQHVFGIATQAVKQFSEGKNMDMVFQDVVYANPRTDITAQVIEVMNTLSDK